MIRKRLRRKDQEKGYDEEKLDNFDKEELDEYEDGEAEAKALRKKNGGKIKKHRNRGGVDNEDYGPEASADE